ncbi:hypothetical protein FSP39_015992 [Pinctada imbricata]|uniref:Serpin domain-containing protein n=1 Tax=Pinctada imbricata TaxID=66713 RepID=A0AA88YDW4_PINIB|nr:hypothetical protein FSP39_015992 [Pinctada imbricata]
MREYQHVIEGTIYQTSCYVLMICGAAAIFIGILGCTGGINENRTVVSALQCCGVKGYNSWNNVTIMPNRFIQEGGITYSYPTSCYRQKSIVSKKDTKKLTTPVIVSYEVNQDVDFYRTLRLWMIYKELLSFATVVIMAAKSESLVKAKIGLPLQQFTLDLLNVLPKNENIFYSPFSISAAIAMTQLGAKEKTLKQIRETMKFNEPDDALYGAFEKYLQLINSDRGGVTLKAANSIYPSSKYPPAEKYVQDCKKAFGVSVETLNYDKAEEARNKINRWVESQTNDRIKDLLPEGSLDPRTMMVLVNAVYFKGNWESQFTKERTSKMQFSSATGSIEVDMMYQKRKFRYTNHVTEQLSVVELPYQGNELSMVIILPDEVNGLDAVERKLTAKMLSDITEDLPEVMVDVWIPKFKMEYGSRLKDKMKSLGMIEAFDRDMADFSGIDPAKDIYIDEIFHKAFVEVNEEGTEAAAATAVKMVKRSIVITPSFRADHPFIFFIKDVKNGVILFAGRVMEPPGRKVDKDEL